jgi:hypothetical protein
MRIEEVGELHQNSDVPEWLDSDEMQIPFLGNLKLTITFQNMADDPAPEEFADAIRSFLRLSEQDRAETNQYVFADYRDFIECVGEDDFDFTIDDESSVWEHVHPTQIYVSRRHYGDKAVYVQIAAECDWEEEHGLQVVFKCGKTLKRVSDQDGHLTTSDAYDRPELEDVIVRKRWD